MATQVDNESYDKFLHTMNSGNTTTGTKSAARPRAANINEFDVAFPTVATVAGEGTAFDPRGGGEGPEDPPHPADAWMASPRAGVRFAGDDDGAPPADDYAPGPTGDVTSETDAHVKERESHDYHQKARLGEVATYPADCYSFIAIHSPFVEPKFFFFGLMVFIFQTAFLFFLAMSLTLYRVGEIDNPIDVIFLGLPIPIPSNAPILATLTQITALLSYCIFSDSSLQDMVKAVELFPRLDRARENDGRRLLIFSCVLRFLQGLLATIVTLLLIITTADVIDIILNFAAVNYISNLDEAAFVLAKLGKYGPRLEKEAKSIETRVVPYCTHRKNQHERHLYAVIPVTLVMLVIFGVVFGYQNSVDWLTKELRVQFRDPTLRPYSGCYDLDPHVSHHKRKNYNRSNTMFFGYCQEEHHWVLFQNEDDGEGGSITDPCGVSPKNQLALSANTDTFDISSSFDELWFTPSGEFVDLYFFGNGESLNCKSFLYNGVCDTSLNTFEHHWDGGDCCATTCSHPNCGVKGVTSAFGVKGQGNGYPGCDDPEMKAVTILLTGFRSSRNESLLDVTDDQAEQYELQSGIKFWTEKPNRAYFIVDCIEDNGLATFVDSSIQDIPNVKKVNVLSVNVDQSMENHAETILVPDGAWCEISVSNTTTFETEWNSEPIWHVNYTVYHGNGTIDEMVSGESAKERTIAFHRIPECYFVHLEGDVDLKLAYTANTAAAKSLRWLVHDNDESGHSRCGDPFLHERFALITVHYASLLAQTIGTKQTGGKPIQGTKTRREPWINSQQQCGWVNIVCDNGSVRSLELRGLDLPGTISTAIGRLTGLERLYYDHNGLSGTIPSVIGLLTDLKYLNLDFNFLTGAIPTEFGNLKHLTELDLVENQLKGTIPTEFGRMVDMRELNLTNNQLSGPIPTEIGRLLNLTFFESANNIMTGPLPTQLGRLTKLKQLNLGENDLTSSIPTEIGLMKSLSKMNLLGNSFEGRIPSEIGLMTNLTEIWLESNDLSGAIPVEVASIMNLQLLELTNNSMTGPMPTQLGELTKLEHLHLGGNHLTGPIPTEIGLMTSLSRINLRGNSLRGPIPSEIGLMTNLTEIHLEGNDFTGTIPVEVASLERLQILTFGGSLTGDIPGNIQTLVPCVLCSGTSYKLKNISDNGPYFSSGARDIDCGTLLEEQQDAEKPFTGNDCEVLKEACIDCTVADNLFAMFGNSLDKNNN